MNYFGQVVLEILEKTTLNAILKTQKYRFWNFLKKEVYLT